MVCATSSFTADLNLGAIFAYRSEFVVYVQGLARLCRLEPLIDVGVICGIIVSPRDPLEPVLEVRGEREILGHLLPWGKRAANELRHVV